MIELRKVPKLSKLDTDELMQLLSEVADDLNDTNARAEQLYELRTRIYVEARSREPAVTYRQLGAVAGTSDVAVVAVMRKVQAG